MLMTRVGQWLNLVERVLWEHEVAGSDPVFPTINYFGYMVGVLNECYQRNWYVPQG